MSKKTLVTILLLSIVVSLFLGCKQDMIETMEKVQAQVEISVQLPQELVGAGYDPDDVKFTLTWYPAGDVAKATEEAFDYDENQVIVFQFTPGEYTFDLTARDKTTDDLKSDGSKTITIDPGQRVKLEIPLTYYDVFGAGTGLVMDKDTYTLTGAVKADTTIDVPVGRKLVLAGGASIENSKTLTVNGDVAVEDGATITGTLKVAGNLTIHGEVIVDGTLDLDGKGWEAVELGAGGSILLNKNNADLKMNGASTWYSLTGAKARYFKEDNTIQLRFITGSGANEVAPAGVGKTPTEAINKVGSGVTLKIPDSTNGFYLEEDVSLIVEDDGILNVETYWFGKYDRTKHKGCISILSKGSLIWDNQLTVGDKSSTVKPWHSWAWKQDGTITEITSYFSPGSDTCNFKFTAKEGPGNNAIDISHPAVVTPITIESGVTATIAAGSALNMRNSIFINNGIVEIYGTLDTSASGSYPGGILENYDTIYLNAGGKLNTSRVGSLTNEGSIVNAGGTWTE
ncbi:MAG: hypothetical protein M0R76_14160 [Proteobacteria bacterium]|nr:hypothetical protein [Pseudomonadota bacterium]